MMNLILEVVAGPSGEFFNLPALGKALGFSIAILVIFGIIMITIYNVNFNKKHADELAKEKTLLRKMKEDRKNRHKKN